jgi:PiT family inorganic phosphate transporter
MGAISYFIASGVGGTAGILVDLLLLIAISASIYWRSRSTSVNPKNVNSEWTGTVASWRAGVAR